MKKDTLIELLKTILKKKRKKAPRKHKLLQKQQSNQPTIRQENVISSRPIPIIPDLNRQLIREFSEYKKDRFVQPDEKIDKPTEINLYKEFVEYKTLSPDQFNKKVSTKFNEFQKVERQKQFNNILLEEASKQAKEEINLKKEESRFNKKLLKLKEPLLRNLKVSKGIRPTETVEPKITPPIIINGDTAPSAFQENDNVGLESQFPEIVSDTFIVQQPQNLGQEQILIKRSRGRPKKGSL